MRMYRRRSWSSDSGFIEVEEDETRCAAALRDGWGRGEQCSRNRPSGDIYCTQHRRLHDELFPKCKEAP